MKDAAAQVGETIAKTSGLWQDAAGRWRTASGRFASDAEKAAAGVQNATASIPGVSGGHFNALREIATGALRAIGEMALRVGIEAAQALGRFVGDSISAAGDFEAGINGLAAVAGDSLAEAGVSFDDVSAKALQLGADTQFSAAQALTAMTELAKGGVSVEQVMGGATDATLALASAAGVDLANAAEIMAKQLGVWERKGVTAVEISNLLAQAANASTVDVEELALGLAQAGGAAQTSGVSFQDLTQTMGLIAPAFSSASDAGTALKTFLLNMTPTTDPAIQTMMELGIITEETGNKFYDASGNFLGMENAAQVLQTAMVGLGDSQRSTALKTMFGADAIRVANELAIAGAAGFNTFGVAMDNAGGSAESAAIKNQGFNFAMETMKGSMETLQIVIGTALLPTLTALVTNFTTGINAVMEFTGRFSALIPEIMNSSDPLNKLFAALRVLLPEFGNIITVAQNVANAFSGVFSSGVQGAGNTLTWFQGLVNTIMPAIQAFIAGALTTIQTFWAANGAQIMLTAQTTWTSVQTIVTTIVQIVSALLAQLAAYITANQTTIQFVITNIWNVIQGVITTVMAAIEVIVRTALALITGDWNNQLTAIHEAGARIFQGILTMITGILELIAARFGTSLDEITATWTSNFSKFSVIAGPYMSQAAEIIQDAINAITGAFDGIKGAIDSAVGAIKRFVDAASKIKVPSLVTPGSPTPLEIGLRGIADAFSASSSAASDFGNAMGDMLGPSTPDIDIPTSIPDLIGSPTVVSQQQMAAPMAAYNGAMAFMAPRSDGATMTNNYNYNFSPTYGSTPPSSAQDFLALQALAGAP